MASTVDQAEFVFAKAAAQRTATLVQVGALAAAVVCITLAAALQTPINRQRKDLQLVMQSNLYKELPPKYAWVSAAGGTFRGIVADFLWMRAEELKQQGKYYESHQLAKWICTLQPRFATVWSFQAWNMSYNISVATHTSRERWQWVYNGIRLLRDEGIPNNEKVVPLYHQLAWTFYHKVGDRLDDYHLTYKRRWATTMDSLLGAPPASVSDEEQVNYLKPVADAPPTLEALLAQRPSVGKLVDDLAKIDVDVTVETRAANQFHPLEISFFKPYTQYQVEKRFAGFRKSDKPYDEHTTKVFALLDAAPADDVQVLVGYLRAKVLREQYKMDPKFMQEMTGKLGPERPISIDWRTPWAHAMYWGMYGTQKGREVKNIKDFDLLNTDRIVLFSLGQLARQGRYIFRANLEHPEESFLDMSPDWRYVEAVHQKCLQLGKVYAEKDEKVDNTAGEAFRDFHINTLQSAIMDLYLSGREQQAMRYYDYLAANYKDQYTGQVRTIFTQNTFQQFIQLQIKEIAGIQYEAIWLIHSLLESGFLALANGQYAEYVARTRNAHVVYTAYQGDKADDREGRRTLPPWDQIVADALLQFVVEPERPLVLLFIVWERLPGDQLDVKRRCYDDVRASLQEMYGRSDLDIDKAFPPPPGMEEWRKSHPIKTPEEVSQEAKDKKKEEDKKQQNR
ncbi:MAG: hypothetical protein HY718_18635 [Planctomycetes bacterium]|nr:hypothetical protein [Planctomycetota bacterium]